MNRRRSTAIHRIHFAPAVVSRSNMTAAHLTNAELAVLELLWNHGELTARQIREHLYAGAQKAQHGTVQRFLQSLEEKGCVARDRSLHVHVFSAAVGREELRRRRHRPRRRTQLLLLPLLLRRPRGVPSSSRSSSSRPRSSSPRRGGSRDRAAGLASGPKRRAARVPPPEAQAEALVVQGAAREPRAARPARVAPPPPPPTPSALCVGRQ